MSAKIPTIPITCGFLRNIHELKRASLTQPSPPSDFVLPEFPYVNLDILKNLYYALIYPFLTYGVIAWGNTYETTLQPLFILQKKAVRIITFSRFDHHSSPLFRSLSVIKIFDLVTLQIAIFMYKFNNNLLPSVFHSFL